MTLMEGFAREIGRALDHALAFELQDEMVERLGVLDRSKNDFLAEVSRELRGPLASVLGYIELLTDESADAVTDEQRRMLSIVERNGEKLLVLIANLLTMSRIEAGTFEPKLAPVDRRRRGRGASATRSRPPSTSGDAGSRGRTSSPGLELVGDESQIERALHNLVSNAVKFTPAGRSHRHLRRAPTATRSSSTCATPASASRADEQDELFSRFFNAKSAPRRATLGTGLGLYIVKQIVDGHDGTVGVVSVQGRGSTFTMRLPVASEGAPLSGGRPHAAGRGCQRAAAQ